MVGITIAGIVVFVLISGLIFLNVNPQFGGKASDKQKREYTQSGHYVNGKFVNESETKMDINFRKMISEMRKRSAHRKPGSALPVEKLDPDKLATPDKNITKLIWFGHSAFLLQLDGKNILIDPMFGEAATPLPWSGPKRFEGELPIEIEDLPGIDAIILSHDHYDHLDYESIQKLKDKTGEYYVPLGVGNHLRKWGIASEKIHELNWWDSIYLDETELVCTPARHFSGRGLLDRNTTLWASWVIAGEQNRIFFSGDSGYGDHFRKIGESYGPFDIALMECGQYNKNWQAIHMMPEKSAQAAIDLKSKAILPIHWGAFTLAFHSWTDPVERVSKKAGELELKLCTPKIGEVVIVGGEDYPNEKWWKMMTAAED